MKQSLLVSIVLVSLLFAKANAESPVEISVAPELWYVKWFPGFEDIHSSDIRHPSYNVNPAFLYGLSASVQHGNTGVVGSYLMRNSEKDINSKAGNNTSSMQRELRLEAVSHLSGLWYLKNRIIAGRFKGAALGAEWEKDVTPVTDKKLPVSTEWFQGDISALFAWEKLQSLGSAFTVGYRYTSYRIPAQIETYDRAGLFKVDFLDTRFSSHIMTFGLEGLPGTQLGWRFAIPRLLFGAGLTTASAPGVKARTSLDGSRLGSLVEVDGAAAYDSAHIAFEFGLRYRKYSVIIGNGGRDDTSSDSPPGRRIALEEEYIGPYTRLALHF